MVVLLRTQPLCGQQEGRGGDRGRKLLPLSDGAQPKDSRWGGPLSLPPLWSPALAPPPSTPGVIVQSSTQVALTWLRDKNPDQTPQHGQ